MNQNSAPPKTNTSFHLYERVAQISVLGLVFLAPLLVVPYTSDLLQTSKWLLLVLASLLTAVSYLLFTVTRKRFEQLVTPLSWPLLLFGIMTLTSSIAMNPYPHKSLIGFGGAFLSLVFLGFFGGSLISKKRTSVFTDVLGLSGALLSISGFMQMVGWGPSRIINQFFIYNLPNDMSFSLAGSGLASVQVVVLALIGVIAKIVTKKKLSNLDMFLVPTLVVGLVINIWSILPGKPASFQLAPLSASWSVAVESIKELRTALIGQGPESYANTYTIFKPNWINGESYWQFNFSSATNFPLTLVVTLGIVGLIAWLLLFSKIVKQSRKELQEKSPQSLPIFLVLISTFVFQFFSPANLVLIAIQAGAIVYWIASRKSEFSTLHFSVLSERKELDHPVNKYRDSVGIYVLSLMVLIGVVYVGFQTSKIFASDYYVYQANKGLLDNNAIVVYENLQKAVQINPFLDSLRRQYALTNLQIAIALSNNTELNEQERSQVVELISQAINEAKAATVLDPNNSANWVALAEVYKNIIGVTEGADQWALDSLVQAVRTNPTNPLLRVDIGLAFFDKQQFQEAGQYFSQAIELKPDLPTGYYHLARVLVNLENYIDAEQAWNQTLALLDQNSEDYDVVVRELDTIKELAEKQRQELAELQQAQNAQNGLDQTIPQAQPAQAPISGSEETSLNNLNKEVLENQPTITPLTEQNLERRDADLVNNPSTQPLDITPETEKSLGN